MEIPRQMFRLLRRRPMTGLIAVLVVVVIGMRLVWGWYAARLVAIEEAQADSMGWPRRYEDIPIIQLSDDENAWTLQHQAAIITAKNPPSPNNSTFELPYYPPFNDKWWELAEASENANTVAFSLAREARQRRRGVPIQRVTADMFQSGSWARHNTRTHCTDSPSRPADHTRKWGNRRDPTAADSVLPQLLIRLHVRQPSG